MSNRTEILAEQLAEVLRVPAASVFEPEIVVIQSRGMQRWLSLELARHNRICANIKYPFPKAFLADMACRLDPAEVQIVEDDAEKVTFKLMRLIPDYLDRREFKRLNHYLADDQQGLKLFQLCQKITYLFDQYQVYRPELLHSWEEGRVDSDSDCRWQAQLWRAMTAEAESEKKVQWPYKIIDAIENDSLSSMRLPARASIFGISYLPPVYLELISKLSRAMHLSLFWLNPSREYWGDIVSERQSGRLKRHAGEESDDLHLASGNRMLAAFGALGRNFMKMLVDCGGQIFEHYEEPATNSILSGIQSDILCLRNPDKRNDASLKDTTVTSSDDISDNSVQFHSCHSPLREMEVLHDNLLALFEADPDLKPGDIIVMAPDIEIYAPYIQAVFGTRTTPASSIPFSIADRNARQTNGMIDGFLALLDMADSRLGVPEIFRLLEFPGIMERFGLERVDLPQIEKWVLESQIRWGADAFMRKETGVPGFKENSWSEGFRRLLLGYALPTEEKALFDGILPYDHIEGSDAVILGNFIDFISNVFKLKSALKKTKPMDEWASTLLDILDQFFAAAYDRRHEIHRLRQTIRNLSEAAADAEYNGAVDLSILRNWLPDLLQNSGGAGGFLGQGVTFCALLPMRSIPFKVVCLIGMDNVAFPRDSQPLDFDLMARDPKPGDRSRRDDDRYLFLEALLSARTTLYISYCGQNIQDNTTIPPSVLVRELLDGLEIFGRPAGTVSGSYLTVQHRLQPFSIDYFSDDKSLFSYSGMNKAICQRLAEPQLQPPFFDEPIPLSEDEKIAWQQVDLNHLTFFWGHPCRFLLRQRMGIALEISEEILKDHERFQLVGLERYQMGEMLLKRQLSPSGSEDQYPLWAASGRLPPANPGRLAFDQLAGEVEVLANRLTRSPMSSDPVRIEIDYRHGPLRLGGSVDNVYPDGRIFARFANMKARDLVQAWICHLALGIASDHTIPVSYLFYKDSAWKYKPVEQAEPILNDLLDLFLMGLTVPIAFAPQTSFAFADAVLRRNMPDDAALQFSKKVWQGTDYDAGEANDPYVKLCFRERDLLSEEFKSLALKIFEPLFQHLVPGLP